jgi:hypothetical protein
MKKVSKPVFCSDSVVTIFQHHSLDQSWCFSVWGSVT